MSNITLSLDLPIKLCLYVFLPTFAIILLLRLVLMLSLKKLKQNDSNRYYRVMSYYSGFSAIIFTATLLIVTVFYAKYFCSLIISKGLVDKYKLIYYLVLYLPLIPGLFLIYYFISLFTIHRNVNDDKEIKFAENDVTNEEVTTKNIESEKKLDSEQSNNQGVSDGIELL